MTDVPMLPPPFAFESAPEVAEAAAPTERGDVGTWLVPRDNAGVDPGAPVVPDGSTNRVDRRARWPRVVAIALVVAVLAAVSGWGWVEHQSARRWRADQLATASRLASSRSTAAHLRDELATTKSNLAAAQQLSSQLAAEKADLTDQRTALAKVLGTAPAATAALNACSAAQGEVGQEALDVADQLIYTYNVDFSSLDSAIATAGTLCATAKAKADTLQQSISDLGL